ncbi:uncharacterized protein N7482_009582 [Penicillium canariense]|uniref:Uncharacterized protein n=1 Tax=Penicillium canariense TaxID=189055 RepID=A0A9W9HTH9_9EURO|nr:uncharacterized protein N7482_009582 [Penicillium canariense]KAJ5153104.1 hypothetical protein N7482_009582 [Penicillium canariense]
MAEGFPMERTTSPDQSGKPTEGPWQCPPFTSTNDATYAPTDNSSSHHSQNGSAPSTPGPEDLLDQISDTTEVKVLRPYAIEEPDDEPVPAVQRRGLPCLPDCFERWQRDMVVGMDDMADKVVTSPGVKLSPTPKRGQKRKPPGSAGAGHSHMGSNRSKSGTRLDDNAAPVPGISPKRRRRRSKPSGNALKISHPVSLNDFRETRANESSSSDLQSSGSSVDTANESALADEMDID